MELFRSHVGGVNVVEFVGEFDAFNLPDTSRAIDAVIDSGEPHVVLNLRRLSFINSSALGYLIKARKRAQAAGGDVVIAQPSGFVRKILATLGLDRVLSVYDTVEAGVGHFTSDIASPGAELGRDVDESLLGENAVLFSLVPAVGEKRYVGRISSLYANGLKFRWEVPGWTKTSRPPLCTANFDKEVHPGRRMRIKFRQPFLVQGKYFEMAATIATVARDVLDDGRTEATFGVRYEDASPDDLALLKRFVDDLDELRREVDEARGHPES